jgi:ubiquitin carboxyl-terminal hydrolase 14
MHLLYPQFATLEQHGGYQQQDANELFTGKHTFVDFFISLSLELIREFSNVSEVDVNLNGEKKAVPVRRFIEGEYAIRMKNTEDEEEPVQESNETFMQLSCFLSAEIRYLRFVIFKV